MGKTLLPAMQKPFFLLLIVALAGPLAAQPVAPDALHPAVPAAFDVAGLHLVLNPEAQRLVQQKADGLSRHQPSFQARVGLADASFPIIDRVLKEEGVPLDFRYLALQESALQGDALSVHDAVGYWQLKRDTATDLGLVVSDEVDERKHLTASTRAAARYLKRSNASLHNWLNALLSYYTGLGGVRPYTLPTDPDATEMAITEATSPYVLMFLAQKVAFEPYCGLNPSPPLRLQEFPAVAGQSLEAQALALHTDPAALVTHNRWLLAPAVPTGRPYTLIVPIGDVTQAAGIVANQRLQSSTELLALPAVGANAAEVRVNNLRALVALPGETTADLARRGHQRLGEFLHHNELQAFDAALAGRPYYLESKRDVAAVEYHVAQPGETVFDVAQKYGIRRKAVLAKNRMARVEELRPGRVLWLQHTRPREVAVEFRALPEGAALERLASATANDAVVEQLNEAARLAKTGEKVKIKIKIKNGAAESKRTPAEDKDGWGETLSSATAAAAAPAPVPAVESVRVAAPVPAPESPPAPDAEQTLSAEAARRPAPVAAAPAIARVPPVAAAPVAKPAPAPVAKPTPLPALSPKPVATPLRAAAAAGLTAALTEATHRVEAGETVYSISRRYQLSPATLMALNHLTPPAGLVVGQVLLLRAQEPAAPAPSTTPVFPSAGNRSAALSLYTPNKGGAPVTAAPAAGVAEAIEHTVAVGETLYSISKRYRVTVAELQVWNGKAATNTSAKTGEVLRVSASGR